MVGYLPGGFRGKCCVCDEVFKDFQWGDLKKLGRRELPMSRGVYVLRLVVDESEEPSDLYQRVDAAYARALELLEKSGWRELKGYFGKRVKRIKNIDPVKCPVIYIGATGRGSGNLRSRFQNLAGLRHTIFYPVFALLLAGWDIDFGWMEFEDAFSLENQLMTRYKAVHKDIPALNKG